MSGLGYDPTTMFGDPYSTQTEPKRRPKRKKTSNKKIQLEALLEQKFQPLFPCTHCDEQFESVDQLFAHNKNHPNPSICPQCKNVETDPALFAAHVWTHMGVRPFRCPQPDCGFRTTLEKSLLEHKAATNHSGQFGLRCPHCPRCFANTVALYAHIRTHEAGYTCPYCHVVHKNPANFTQHVRKHTNEKPYRCVCGYRAVSKGLLKSHALKCAQVDCSDYKASRPRKKRKSSKSKNSYAFTAKHLQAHSPAPQQNIWAQQTGMFGGIPPAPELAEALKNGRGRAKMPPHMMANVFPGPGLGGRLVLHPMAPGTTYHPVPPMHLYGHPPPDHAAQQRSVVHLNANAAEEAPRHAARLWRASGSTWETATRTRPARTPRGRPRHRRCRIIHTRTRPPDESGPTGIRILAPNSPNAQHTNLAPRLPPPPGMAEAPPAPLDPLYHRRTRGAPSIAAGSIQPALRPLPRPTPGATPLPAPIRGPVRTPVRTPELRPLPRASPHSQRSQCAGLPTIMPLPRLSPRKGSSVHASRVRGPATTIALQKPTQPPPAAPYAATSAAAQAAAQALYSNVVHALESRRFAGDRSPIKQEMTPRQRTPSPQKLKKRRVVPDPQFHRMTPTSEPYLPLQSWCKHRLPAHFSATPPAFFRARPARKAPSPPPAPAFTAPPAAASTSTSSSNRLETLLRILRSPVKKAQPGARSPPQRDPARTAPSEDPRRSTPPLAGKTCAGGPAPTAAEDRTKQEVPADPPVRNPETQKRQLEPPLQPFEAQKSPAEPALLTMGTQLASATHQDLVSKTQVPTPKMEHTNGPTKTGIAGQEAPVDQPTPTGQPHKVKDELPHPEVQRQAAAGGPREAEPHTALAGPPRDDADPTLSSVPPPHPGADPVPGPWLGASDSSKRRKRVIPDSQPLPQPWPQLDPQLQPFMKPQPHVTHSTTMPTAMKHENPLSKISEAQKINLQRAFVSGLLETTDGVHQAATLIGLDTKSIEEWRKERTMAHPHPGAPIAPPAPAPPPVAHAPPPQPESTLPAAIAPAHMAHSAMSPPQASDATDDIKPLNLPAAFSSGPPDPQDKFALG